MISFLNRHNRAYIAAAVIVCASLYAGEARAAELSGACGFEEKFAELAEVRENTALFGQEKIREELRIRKEILALVISCGEAEVMALEKEMAELENAPNEANALTVSITSALRDARAFYGREREKIGDLGIQGTKEVAAEVRSWREGTFISLKARVHAFVLWAKNQGLFHVAQTRFAEITKTIDRLNLKQNKEYGVLYEEAARTLSTAEAENAEARKWLEELGGENNVQEKIKISLELLAKTYETFFALSEAVSKILPQ